MRKLTALLVVLSGLAVACSSASAGSNRSADLAKIMNLEVIFHGNQTTNDVDGFMSAWDRNATLTTGGQTYRGFDAIREFWSTKSPAFDPKHDWIDLTATQRNVAKADGDHGTLHFECYHLDIPTKVAEKISVVDATVVHRQDRWLLDEVRIAPLANLSSAGM